MGIMDSFKDYTPRPQQEDALRWLEKNWDSADVFVLQLPVACHKLGQKIWMLDGTLRAIEDVVAGDIVLGPDGTGRRVLQTHRGMGPLFKVETRGGTFHLTGNHILPMRKWTRYMKNCERTSHCVHVEQTVYEWLNSSKENRLNTYLYSSSSILWKNAESKWENVIPPYLLGVWLGDGTAKTPEITNIESEIISAWYTLATDLGLQVSRVRKYAYYMTRGRDVKKLNTFWNALKDLVEVDGSKSLKFNPLKYPSSIRAELLAGLVDTDGHISRGAICEVTQKRKELAELVYILANSLGYVATPPSPCEKRAQTGGGGTYYRVTFSRQIGSIELPTRVARKQLNPIEKNTHLRRFDITEDGEGEWAGITVDGDNLYIMDNFIVTHNCGKSAVAMTIARWLNKEKKLNSQILVPTNVLLEQYKSTYPRLHSLQRKDLYRCKRYADQPELLQEDANCEWTKEVFGSHCDGCCYLKAVRQSHVVPFMVCNYWTYMAHKLFRPVVIMDECHNLLHIIRDLEGKRLWRKDYHYPSTITTYGDLLKWVESHPRRDADTKLKLLYEELNTGRGHFLVETSVDLYRGRQEECLKLCPIDVRNARPYLWPHANSKGKGGVSKIILMSATFSRVDLEMLGLNKRRVAIMETGSPIPPERRPVYFMPIVNSSFKFQNASLPKLVSFLKELATSRPGVKGFVHTTYGMGSKMKELLSTDRRFFFHSSDNKIEKFKEWKASDPKEGRIFVGCGMDEGIDLNGEEFGWQVLTKAQYASLAEPAIKHQAEERPAEYTWDAMRKCAQACGRICRDPQDYGETYLVDLTFKRLFKQAKEFEVVPNWLVEQLDTEAKEALLA